MKPTLISKVKLDSLSQLTPSPVTSLLLHAQTSHAHILKSGIPIAESKLVQCYCNARSFADALQLFGETPHWDLVPATAAITAFERQGRCKEALALFSQVLHLRISPNQFTLSTAIHASTSLQDLLAGKQLHARAIKVGLHSDVFLGSSVLHHYAKLGDIEDAREAFEETTCPNVVSYTALISGYLQNERPDDALSLFRCMPERNVVSWNAMIGGCSQIGLNEMAVNLFVKMCRRMKPNESTFPCVFSAAANIAALGMGRSFHAYAIKCEVDRDVFVGNSMVSFYAKCGSMEDGLRAFDGLGERNVVSWNAIICGYAQNGQGKEALDFFWRMRESNMKPNSVTVLCVLFACNHSGLTDEGYTCFDLMRKSEPNMLSAEHYACMVDLLSRAGCFEEAEKLLKELPFTPGIGFWKALLGGCQINSNTEIAEFAMGQILALDPEDSSSYILLSNVYSAAGRWHNASMIRRKMKDKGMVRIPGCSWIEIKNRIHVFVTGDRTQAQIDEMNVLLRMCFEHMKETPRQGLL